MPKKLILIVVDGMTPATFERAVESTRAPTLAQLAANGAYNRATSVFPSLTPVCLSSIATGATPEAHHIPHLVWWHRSERRIVEYGSSFAALRAAGMAQSITDTIYNMNQQHLADDVSTIYETLEEQGLTTAAVNITCYRGGTKYLPTLPWVTKPAYGPKRFFFYSLFESDQTGAPLAVRNRAAGSVDAYASVVGRWLVTRDGFDFLAYYLSDFDYASHAHGPTGAEDVALARVDAHIRALVDAAGGLDHFLERYAVILLSDHGQTQVAHVAQLEESLTRFADNIVVTASNRAAQVYLLPDARVDASELARALDGVQSVDMTFRIDDSGPVARRDGADFALDQLEHPDAVHRVSAALANPNAGELLVSAAEGWEFADLGGRHHAGGGSHGSLVEGDSIVPVLTIGLDRRIDRITDVKGAAVAHFSAVRA